MTTTATGAVRGSALEVAAATHLAAVAGALLDVLADALEAQEDLGGTLRRATEIVGAAAAHVDADLEASGPYNDVRLCDALMSVIGGPLSAYAVSYNEVRGRFDELDSIDLSNCVNAHGHAMHVSGADIDGIEPLVDIEDYRPEGGAW